MSNGRPQQGGKPHGAPGISQADLQQLRARVDAVQKQVQEHLAEKNQWSATVRGWQGSQISVSLLDSTKVVGKLLWIDRYTLCVETNLPGTLQPVIIHKAAISLLHQVREAEKPETAPSS